jgi:hypothetical protein
LLWRLGVRREHLVERLRNTGAAVPRAHIPEQREIDVGDRVWFDRTQTERVLDHLARHARPGAHWGFNYEGDRAWVIAESTLDMQALVDEALNEAQGG